MNESGFFHFDAGNVTTWALIVITFTYNYGKSAQRFLENSRRINEASIRLTGLETNLQSVQTYGSAGAKHMFELLSSQVSAHEVRITLHDSTAKDVVEIKTKVDIMMRMMQHRWKVGETGETM